MNQTCPACGGSGWEDFLHLESERSLTSDQRIVRRALHKVICTSCGLVRNRVMLGSQRLEDYEYDYALNTTGGEEHIYFSADGQHRRSQAIFDWMKPHLPSRAMRVTEIGCGMGNLLDHLARHYPDAAMTGIEGNRQAAELARKRHADIRQHFVGSDAPPLPVSDLVIAYGVAEHVEDPDGFLAAVHAACHTGSTVVLCVPVQDHDGYDVYFSDHIWHFTLAQFAASLSRRGFQIIASDAASSVVQGFGLVAMRIGDVSGAPVPNAASLQTANRDHWQMQLGKANRIIGELVGKTVALYGASEVMSLLMAYTSLSKSRIAFCLDEDLNKTGTVKHGIAVHYPDHIEAHPVDAVLLTVNPRYNEQIRAKLAPFSVPVLPCFD